LKEEEEGDRGRGAWGCDLQGSGVNCTGHEIKKENVETRQVVVVEQTKAQGRKKKGGAFGRGMKGKKGE